MELPQKLTLAIWSAVLPLAPMYTMTMVDEMPHGEKKRFWVGLVLASCLKKLMAKMVFAT